MKYYKSILETIGKTPLVKLNKITQDIDTTILVKLESFNPGGSVKDRIGIMMIETAEKQGLIKPGYTIVEPTSGNTGIGLALAAVVKGYKIIFTIPDKMSPEKINLLKAFGAKVIVTPTVPPEHPFNYVKVAERIVQEQTKTFMPNQYFNPANPETHYRTTGPEIWKQTEGSVDVFVAGIGTGGTISGIGKYLKEKNPKIRVVGVDPEGSMYHHEFYKSQGEIHDYKVEGIGEDFIPASYDPKIVDEIIVVSDKDAFLTARRLTTEEGVFAGGSSGAAVFAALQVAKKLDKEQTVVVILPDTGRNYLTKIYSDEWLTEHGFVESSGERISVDELLKTKTKQIKKLIFVSPEDKVSKAIALMTQYDISQIPVVKESVQVGCMSEKSLIEKMCKLCDVDKPLCSKLCERNVEEFMDSSLPTVNKTDTILNPFLLMKKKNAVLVLEDGKVVDIITTIDVINYMINRWR